MRTSSSTTRMVDGVGWPFPGRLTPPLSDEPDLFCSGAAHTSASASAIGFPAKLPAKQRPRIFIVPAMQGFFAGGRWGAAGHGRFHWQQRQVCPKGSKLADLGIPGSVLICRSEGFLDRLWRFPLTVPHKLAGGRRMSSKSALLGLI